MKRISIIVSSNEGGVDDCLIDYNIEFSSNSNLEFTTLKLVLGDIFD